MTRTSEGRDCGKFSLAEARRIVAPLFRPRPWVYWLDFLGSISAGTVFFILCYFTPDFSLPQVACFFLSSVLMYRCVMFIHELTHFKPGTFRAFRIIWNLLCGIPFLAPSFTYDSHIDHHRSPTYGTKDDGEYLPLGTRPPWNILLYLGQIFFIPVVVILRFLVITPLTWILPGFHAIVLRHASSLVIDLGYVRKLPGPKRLRIIRLQEACCFVWILLVAVVPVAVWGAASTRFYVHVYLTALLCNAMNSLRTAGAHRYRSDEHRMTHVEQLLDSVNYPYWPLLTGLWAPVGLRFHALHHLFPSLPYHNLPEAHRRLMRELPADSPYRATVSRSLLLTLVDLFRASIRSGNAKPSARTA